ncbi:hypothetical protein FJTKL_14102 [Diaporthe vaccinii]|uniref:YCII-related domain-containing protein n=1 Tax=Diaporthe vaccinii TaxID=105482 RepID=A0ABR4E930_9PEZI
MAARLNAIANTFIASARRPAISVTASQARLGTTQFRMASSTPRTYEWLVVVPDKPGALAKRLEVRPQHFEGLTKLKESGAFKMGGNTAPPLSPLPGTQSQTLRAMQVPCWKRCRQMTRSRA